MGIKEVHHHQTKNHVTDINRNRTLRLALAKHSDSSSHHIFIENVKLIHKEKNYLKRKIKEALEIEKRSNIMNKDEGLKISNTWKPILEKGKYHKRLHGS